MPSLLDRLEQRKLVQWALAYLAGGWVVLQIVDQLAARSIIPELAYRAALVVVLSLLPPVVVLWSLRNVAGGLAVPA